MEPLGCDHYGEADSIQSNLQRSIIQFQICRPTTSTGKVGRKGSIFTCFIHHFNVDIWEEDHRYTRNLTNHINPKDLNIFCLCLKYPFCLRVMWCYMDLLPPVHFYKLYLFLLSKSRYFLLLQKFYKVFSFTKKALKKISIRSVISCLTPFHIHSMESVVQKCSLWQCNYDVSFYLVRSTRLLKKGNLSIDII